MQEIVVVLKVWCRWWHPRMDVEDGGSPAVPQPQAHGGMRG